MSSKRRIRRKSCERKHRFESLEEAQVVRDGMAVRRNVYRCQFCGGYHIGRSARKGSWGHMKDTRGYK